MKSLTYAILFILILSCVVLVCMKNQAMKQTLLNGKMVFASFLSQDEAILIGLPLSPDKDLKKGDIYGVPSQFVILDDNYSKLIKYWNGTFLIPWKVKVKSVNNGKMLVKLKEELDRDSWNKIQTQILFFPDLGVMFEKPGNNSNTNDRFIVIGINDDNDITEVRNHKASVILGKSGVIYNSTY